jgi:hypothetical protein
MQVEVLDKPFLKKSQYAVAEATEAASQTERLFGASCFHYESDAPFSYVFCKELLDDMEPLEMLDWFEGIAEEILKLIR